MDKLYFTTGREALNYVVNFCKKNKKKQDITVWLPELICRDLEDAIGSLSVKILYYPLNPSLTVDWLGCTEKAKESAPDIFVFVQYFGFYQELSIAQSFCLNWGALLVEDRAHQAYQEPLAPIKSDFVIYCPRKIFSVSQGAFLLFNYKNLLTDEGSFLSAIEPNHLQGPLLDGPTDCKNLYEYKNSSNRLIIAAQFVFYYFFLKLKLVYRYFKKLPCKNYFEDEAVARQTRILFVEKFLQNRKILNFIIHKKLANYTLLRILLRNAKGKLLEAGEYKKAFPFMAYYVLPEQKMASELFDGLRKLGFQLGCWPCLPQSLRDNKQMAYQIRTCSVTLPISPEISWKKTVSLVENIYKKENSDRGEGLFLEPIESSYYEKRLKECVHSCLTQSGFFVENKARWKKEYFCFKKGQKEIAIALILVRNLPLIGKIYRLNGGPSFFEEPSVEDIMEMALCLRKQFGWKKRKLFSWRIIDVEEPAVTYVLQHLGMRRLVAGKIASARLNLLKPEEELFKNLEGKWRNQLRQAQKSEIVFKTLEEKDKPWVLNEYDRLKRVKGFHGLSSDFVDRIFKRKEIKTESLVGFIGEECVACVILWGHGNTITYLIGINTPNGRKKNAHNLLLWQAVVESKRRGYHYFDLGGINPVTSPDIARFKKGLGGKPYFSLGEWVF